MTDVSVTGFTNFLDNNGTTTIVATQNNNVNIARNYDKTKGDIYNTGTLIFDSQGDSDNPYTKGAISVGNGNSSAEITGNENGKGEIYIKGQGDFSSTGTIENNKVILGENENINLDTLKLNTKTSLSTTADKASTNVTIKNLVITDATQINLQNNTAKDSISIHNVLVTEDSGTGTANVNLDADLSITEASKNNEEPTGAVKDNEAAMDKINIEEIENANINITGVKIVNDMAKGVKELYTTAHGINGPDNTTSEVGTGTAPNDPKNIIKTKDYAYSVTYSPVAGENNQEKARFDFKKEYALSGLAHAIAQGDAKYDLDGQEDVDVWGLQKNGEVNDGTFLDDMTINGNGDKIVGYDMNSENFTIDGGHKVTINDVSNIEGFQGIKLDNGTLNLKDTNSTVSINATNKSNLNIDGNADLSVGVQLSDNSVLNIAEDGKLNAEQGRISAEGSKIILGKNSSITASSLSLDDQSTLDMSNGTIDEINVNDFAFTGEKNILKIDADLSGKGTSDKINNQNLSTNNDTITIDEIKITQDMDKGVKRITVSPIANGSEENIALDSKGTGNITLDELSQLIVKSDKFSYIVNIIQEVADDAKTKIDAIEFIKDKILDPSLLEGLAKAIHDGEKEYSFTEDEIIDLWSETVGSKLIEDITVNGNGKNLVGSENEGIFVETDKELTLKDIADISGFDSTKWQGGAIHNEGTTNIVADKSDVNFGTSYDNNIDPNNNKIPNAIHNTGTLNLTAADGKSITFEDSANITGDKGQIVADGKVTVEGAISGNDIKAGGRFTAVDVELNENGKISSLDDKTANIEIDTLTGIASQSQDPTAPVKAQFDLQNNVGNDTIKVNNANITDLAVKVDADLSDKGSMDTLNFTSPDAAPEKVTVEDLKITKDMDFGIISQTTKLYGDTVITNTDSAIGTTQKTINSADNEYSVAFNKDNGEYTFTKEARISGLPKAMVDKDATYELTDVENIDVWARQEDGSMNDGSFLADMQIKGNNNEIVGYQTKDEPLSFKINGNSVAFNDVANIRGFDSINATDGSKLTLNNTNVIASKDAQGATTAATKVNVDNATLNVTDSKVDNITANNGSKVTFEGNVEANQITGDASKGDVNINLTKNTTLTITDAGILDLAGKTFTLDTGSGVKKSGTAQVVLDTSTVNMQNDSIDTIEASDLAISGNNKITLDTNLADNTIDQIKSDTVSAGTQGTTQTDTSITISELKVLEDLKEGVNESNLLAPVENLAHKRYIICASIRS